MTFLVNQIVNSFFLISIPFTYPYLVIALLTTKTDERVDTFREANKIFWEELYIALKAHY